VNIRYRGGGLKGTPSLAMAVGNQVEEMMRFFNQKSGNNRKFEYSNRIDQKIDRCSQQNHDVLIPISKEGAQKIKVPRAKSTATMITQRLFENSTFQTSQSRQWTCQSPSE
jgi:hypothetical protein